MSRHVIVISEDAMVFEDVETLKRLPTFGKIWDKCARVNKVRSIYPTVTYPAHATMMTGVKPGRHGIANNEVAKMGEKSSDWEWFADALQVPTVFDAAHEAGFTTAVAGCGTALTADHIKLISQYADEVVLCYDSDEAGQRAAHRAMGIFAKVGLDVRILQMQGVKDPDEYIKKFCAEKFR